MTACPQAMHKCPSMDMRPAQERVVAAGTHLKTVPACELLRAHVCCWVEVLPCAGHCRRQAAIA